VLFAHSFVLYEPSPKNGLSSHGFARCEHPCEPKSANSVTRGTILLFKTFLNVGNNLLTTD